LVLNVHFTGSCSCEKAGTAARKFRISIIISALAVIKVFLFIKQLDLDEIFAMPSSAVGKIINIWLPRYVIVTEFIKKFVDLAQLAGNGIK
jgi:hypothetical protein